MTQQQWDWIGYGVWALIIWVTLKQFMQTRREFRGSGVRILLGDWLLIAPLPWIAYCMGSRATLEQLLWTIGLGVAIAIPYILTSRFVVKDGGRIFFKSSWIFYVILIGFPYVRYLIRDKVFHTYPILSLDHRPDIELMLAMYIAALVIYTFLWRTFMYAGYVRLQRKQQLLKNTQVANLLSTDKPTVGI
ncbi:hypothetical protein Back11_49050 [Paenibacillus baekrokdamisoli]|uniref:Uncharacterized protein n=1 Tax=Paenibacillus baekrokdamisoli TaxID=1712516 RepID=A0A3G9IXF0_9BACL|nr:CcdC protein domain-containing protein [Paenibacillus baekrokdamisoli]MBB3068729.1 membrane protein CcdC involved in cytochrome C biogenesis [Paenibacillus baekrokdamisoli]BBH23560.1 hypothetical protein Back11_49050 [Paenibacillus baekrokdamisoli]